MKYRFTRTQMVAGLAVALTWVGQPAAWADCYQDGLNEGRERYESQLLSCNDGRAQCDAQLLSCNDGRAQCDAQLSSCNEEKSKLITQENCNAQKSGLLSQDQCDSKYDGYIHSSECPVSTVGICKSTHTLISSSECPVSDEATCNQKYDNLIAKNECDYSGYITQSSCDSEKKTISDQLSSCQTEKGGLISQNACNALYAGKIDRSVCETEKNTAIAQYTGYVDATGNALPCNGIAPNSDDAAEGSPEKQCAEKLGFDKGYDKGKTAGTTGTATEVAKSTGYVKDGVVKSCGDQDADQAECAKNQGFAKGYEDGKTAGTTGTATEVAKSTGYVKDGVVKSCGDQDADQAECAKNQGFAKGYEDGKMAGTAGTATEVAKSTGYVKDGVVKSCGDQDADQAECAKNQGFAKGYEDGKTAGTTGTATEVAKYTGYVKDGVVKSCGDQDADQAECAKNQGFAKGYEDGKTAGTTGTATEVAQYTGYVDPATSQPKSCNEPGADAAKCNEKQGFTAGYKARDTFCQNNPEHCIQAYLQGFYKFFVKRRLPKEADGTIVKDFDDKFPGTLEVLSQGGPTANEIADQWRYTWKKTTASNCRDIQNGDRFRPLQDKQDAVCLIEEDDKGEKGDGSSLSSATLAPNQSLGYTVYLVVDKTNDVKATMEIIFSPNQ